MKGGGWGLGGGGKQPQPRRRGGQGGGPSPGGPRHRPPLPSPPRASALPAVPPSFVWLHPNFLQRDPKSFLNRARAQTSSAVARLRSRDPPAPGHVTVTGARGGSRVPWALGPELRLESTPAERRGGDPGDPGAQLVRGRRPGCALRGPDGR